MVCVDDHGQLSATDATKKVCVWRKMMQKLNVVGRIIQGVETRQSGGALDAERGLCKSIYG